MLTRTHTPICTDSHLCSLAHTHTHSRTHSDSHPHSDTFLHTQTHLCSHTHTHTRPRPLRLVSHMHTHSHVCSYARSHRTLRCTHAHALRHTHTHIRTDGTQHSLLPTQAHTHPRSLTHSGSSCSLLALVQALPLWDTCLDPILHLDVAVLPPPGSLPAPAPQQRVLAMLCMCKPVTGGRCGGPYTAALTLCCDHCLPQRALEGCLGPSPIQ